MYVATGPVPFSAYMMVASCALEKAAGQQEQQAHGQDREKRHGGKGVAPPLRRVRDCAPVGSRPILEVYSQGRRLNNGRCVFPAPKTWGGTLVNISHLANQSFHVIRSYQQ